jgi:hypothetical protein
MPGGGQLPLVAYGNQNAYINGNPEITNFYKVFKRYTHFSQEPISIPMDGPNELAMDTPIRIRAKIPRHADLMTDLYFLFRVPEMFSKLFVNEQTQNTCIPAFRWIHALGALMIDNVAIFVGGSKIQEFPGEWLAARATIDYPSEKYARWRELVGDVPELNEPEWGVYGKSPNYPYQKGEYPNVVAEVPSIPTPAMAPSTPERTIRVPLPFWFTEGTGTALPLIALQYHDVEVQITMRTMREMYRIMDIDTNREPVRCGRRLDIAVDSSMIPVIPTSYNPADPTSYDNLTLQSDYISDAGCNLTIKNFYTDVGQTVPTLEGYNLEPRLEGNYVYLTGKEQVVFAGRELQHIVHQVQTFRFPSVTARTKLDLDAHNVMHRLVFYGRRSDAIESRNDYINLSNWKNKGQSPYWPLSAGAVVPNSGRFVPYTQFDILRSARLVIAGNEVFEEKEAKYFEVQAPFTSTEGDGCNGGSRRYRPDEVMGPIYQLPFALHASDHQQPSGTLNASMLREIQLEVNPWTLDPGSNYTYDFTVFVESLNLVKFQSGMGGLAYAV